jgi:Kef-type K+ transport system membrane component KefB
MDASADREPSPHGVRVGWYVTLLAATVGIATVGFLIIAAYGHDLARSALIPEVVTGAPAAVSTESHVLARLVIALSVIVGATRLLGAAFRRLGQPAVVGELLAGILLGPSVVGAIAPMLQAVIFPSVVLPPLGLLAELSVVLFMFIVGLELDMSLLAGNARAAALISHASIVLPFLMGSALSLTLYPALAGATGSFTVFALFVGVAMSVTAFPVLARILTDYDLHRSKLGLIALSSAAVDDVTAWCLLAVVVGVARAEAGAGLVTTGLTAVFIGLMLMVVRPLVVRMAARDPGPASIGPLVGGLVLSVLAADAIGIHGLFGAFLFGALIPSHSPAAIALTSRLRGAVTLLLPTFFAVTGLRTQVGLISGPAAWLTCVTILVVACAGKFGGSYVAARAGRLPAREALAIGALMNTRGLVQLVVLDVGLNLKVISPALFAMLVLMALVTTAATTPVLSLLGWRSSTSRAI